MKMFERNWIGSFSKEQKRSLWEHLRPQPRFNPLESLIVSPLPHGALLNIALPILSFVTPQWSVASAGTVTGASSTQKDHEFFGMMFRVLRGMRVDHEPTATELIALVGYDGLWKSSHALKEKVKSAGT